jgi:hypothetical protein
MEKNIEKYVSILFDKVKIFFMSKKNIISLKKIYLLYVNELLYVNYLLDGDKYSFFT